MEKKINDLRQELIETVSLSVYHSFAVTCEEVNTETHTITLYPSYLGGTPPSPV